MGEADKAADEEVVVACGVANVEGPADGGAGPAVQTPKKDGEADPVMAQKTTCL